MKFLTKPLTLSQRIECNTARMEVTPAGNVFVGDVFKVQITYLRNGLKSVNGVEVTDDNFDEIANGLTNDEIKEIADQIADETNFTKKKKS